VRQWRKEGFEMKKLLAALIVALIFSSLVPTVVGADGGVGVGATTNSNGNLAWGVYANINSSYNTTTARGTVLVTADENYSSCVTGSVGRALRWQANLDQKALKVVTDLAGVCVRLHVMNWTIGPDGQPLRVKGAVLTKVSINQNVDEMKRCPPAMTPFVPDGCGGYFLDVMPSECDGNNWFIYGVVEGGKRTENGIHIPLVSNLAPNMLTWVKHTDLFQPLAIIPYSTVRWVGDPPANAMQLGNTLINKLGSGGSSPNQMAALAETALEEGMLKPTSGFKVTLHSSDGTPFTGTLRFRMAALFDNSEWAPSQWFRGPVISFGPTTPGNYRFTFYWGSGKVVTMDRAVTRNTVIDITLP